MRREMIQALPLQELHTRHARFARTLNRSESTIAWHQATINSYCRFVEHTYGVPAPITLHDFTLERALRYTLGQRANRLQFRCLMDQGVSLLVNLGGLDPDTQRMLGCLFTVGVEEAALSREDIPEAARRPYTLVVDEFSQFAAQSQAALERVLALTRKFGLSLIVANQTLSQTGRRLEGALQNAGQVVFRVGWEDAALVAPRLFTPDPYRLKQHPDMRTTYMNAAEQRLTFEHELTTLAPREAYVRLGDTTVKLRSLGLPPSQVSRIDLQTLKERYARLLLTPREEIQAVEAADRPDDESQQEVGESRTGQLGVTLKAPPSAAPAPPRPHRRHVAPLTPEPETRG